MATKTTNYNLTKPSGSENADIDVINANMDIIDNALGTKANKSEIPDVSGYLPKSGGTMSGTLNLVENGSPSTLWRHGLEGYRSGVAYKTNGNEAVCFENENPVTSWIFRCYNSVSLSGTQWNDVTPSMQIKNQRVVINKLIGNDADAEYNLDVGGTANATTIYQGGKQVANKEDIPDVSGKANLNGGNEYEGDQTILGKTLLKYWGSDTPLTVQTTASSTGCYIELKNSEGATLGYYGANSSRRPVFYVGGDREFAFLDEVPKITASTTDIGEGSSLATGTLYLVYE